MIRRASPLAHQPERSLGARVTALALAAGVLGLGCTIYLVDRDPARVWLLPAAWTLPAWRGLIPTPLSNSLPSFAHAFAFSVLTALCLRPGRAAVVAACGGWFVVDALFEMGQHAALSAAVAAELPHWFDAVPVLDHVGRYLLQGGFAWGDLAAAALGALAAGALLLRMQGYRRWGMR